MQLHDAKAVPSHKRLNNLVSKPGARSIYILLTASPHSTQGLFTDLLTAASAEEESLTNAMRRNALKSTVAAVWECVRYGWQQAAFGRIANPRATLGQISCRRTRVLMQQAVRCGAKIAQRQALAGA